MGVVLRLDLTSSLWFLIGPSHPTHALDADWSKIIITEYRRGFRHCVTPGTLKELEMPRSLQITWSLAERPPSMPVTIKLIFKPVVCLFEHIDFIGEELGLF